MGSEDREEEEEEEGKEAEKEEGRGRGACARVVRVCTGSERGWGWACVRLCG